MQTANISAQPIARQRNTDLQLHPVADCQMLELTDDETRRGCRIFRLPADLTQLGADVYAVCEPAQVWQWLPVGALTLYTACWEWERKNEQGAAQPMSSIITKVGRVLDVEQDDTHRATSITFADLSGENEWERLSGPEVCETWLIGRTIIAKANRARLAA